MREGNVAVLERPSEVVVRDRGEAIAPRRDAGAPPQPTILHPRVLLVGNGDVVATGQLAAAFEAAGFSVRAAENGLDAIFEIEHARPDLVVTGLDVPIVSGFRLVQLLKRDSETADLPVMVLSPLHFQEVPEVGRAGVHDFVSTRLPAVEVVARAHGVLARVAAA